MSDFFPIVVAVLVVIANGILAEHRGNVSLFAGGFAALGALVVLSLGFHWLPRLSETYLDLSLDWVVVATVTGAVAFFLYIVLRILGAWGFRRLLGPDSRLHFLAEGTGGAIASLLPSLVVIGFLFLCFRIAGTVQELNYVASLSRERITGMGGKIPPYPRSAAWRNRIEDLPVVPGLLDRVDPFSHRGARNTAALVMMDRVTTTRNVLRDHSETETLSREPAFEPLSEEPGIAEALEEQDRVALVLHPEIQRIGRDSRLSGPLERLHLRAVLEDFVTSLDPPEPVETPDPAN